MGTEHPPGAEEVEAIVRERCEQAAQEGGLQQSLTVPWRGETTTIPVISIPVAVLKYNPDSRRLAAQRTLDPEEDRRAQEAPWSDASQAYFERLLRGKPSEPETDDPEFLRLQQDLEARGQVDPGIITRSGVLVNGNTRRAALRELGVENMRVAVLPNDASLPDREAIELELQLKQEYRRPYSFINRLLALKKEEDRGISPDRICRSFGIQQKTLRRSMWILSLIEDAVARSRVVADDGSVTALRLIDFEDDQGKLEEAYAAWVKIPEGRKDDREALRETRLAAIILGFPKTSVRGIRDGFAEQELAEWLPQTPGVTQPPAIPPGLGPEDGVVLDPPTDLTRRIHALTDDVLRRRGKQVETKQPDDVLEKLWDAFDAGIQRVRDLDRLRERSEAPADALSDAVEDVKKCTALLVSARVAGGAALEELDEQAANLREELAQLARQLGSQDITGEGLGWIIDATS